MIFVVDGLDKIDRLDEVYMLFEELKLNDIDDVWLCGSACGCVKPQSQLQS